jgi:hypothetical protein
MKTLYSLIFCLALCATITAQNWDWANKLSGNANSKGYTICRDQLNCVYVSGSCSAFVNADNHHLNAGNFIIKYDPSGSVIWAKNVGYVATKMCTDWIGNLYVVVTYSGNIATATNTFASAGGWDFLLVRLDVSGNESWARSYGGKNNDNYMDMVSDPSGNLFITGWCDHPKDTLLFSNLTFADTSAYGNFFLSKTDPSGNTLWVTAGLQSSDSSYYFAGRWLAIDNNQDILVLGDGGHCNGSPCGFYFWSRVDQNGNVLSTKWLPNAYLYYIYCLDRDPNGNIYIIDDGGNHPGLGVLRCYDPNWNELWNFTLGGQYECFGLFDVHVDNNGNSYVYGYDVDTVYASCVDSLNQAFVLNHRVPFAGQTDAVVVKVTNTGNLDWIEHGGGPGVDYPLDMCVTGGGDCYITGGYNIFDNYHPFIFGTATFGNYSLSSDGSVTQCYTAKIGNHTAVGIAKTVSDENNIRVYPNPAYGELHIDVPENMNLKISDVLGRCVCAKQLSAGSNAVNIFDQPKGIYIVELSNTSYSKKSKIVLR